MKLLLNTYLYVNSGHFTKNISKHHKNPVEQMGQNDLHRSLKRRAERSLTLGLYDVAPEALFEVFGQFTGNPKMSTLSVICNLFVLLSPLPIFINTATSGDTGFSSHLLVFLSDSSVAFLGIPSHPTQADGCLAVSRRVFSPPSPLHQLQILCFHCTFREGILLRARKHGLNMHLVSLSDSPRYFTMLRRFT